MGAGEWCPPAPKNPLPEFHRFPLRSSLDGADKSPTPCTLRNPHSTVKQWKFTNPFRDEDVESSVVLIRSSAARCGIARAEAPRPRASRCYWPPHPSAGYNSPVPPVSQTIRVTVLFFGRLKELTGHAEDSIRVRGRRDDRATFSLSIPRAIPSSQNTAPRLSLRATRNSPLGYASPFRRRSRVSPARERRLTHQYGNIPSR